MSPELIGQLVLYVCSPLCGGVVLLMGLAYLKERNVVLFQNLIVMVLLTLGAILFGLIFVNNDQLDPPIDPLTTKYITRYFWLALGTIPALAWLSIRFSRK